MKSKITGRDFQEGEFEANWQQFCGRRQEDLEEKLGSLGGSSEYVRLDRFLGDALGSLGNQEKADEIMGAVIALQVNATYAHYNRGFFGWYQVCLNGRKVVGGYGGG